MIATSLFSMLLLGISGLLLDAHRRTHRRVAVAACRDQLGPGAERFARAQYRRRMFASGTIGLVGAAIAIAPLVPDLPVPMAMYLILLVGACGWIMLLALVDVFATHVFYRRLRGEEMSAHLKLVKELKAAREKGK